MKGKVTLLGGTAMKATRRIARSSKKVNIPKAPKYKPKTGLKERHKWFW